MASRRPSLRVVVVAVWHESGGFSASGMICSHPSKHLKTTARKGAHHSSKQKKKIQGGGKLTGR